MAQRRILEQALPVTTELDNLIYQMEVSLGKAKSVSPFQSLYKKHDVQIPVPKPAEIEEKKAAQPKDAKAAQQ